jgi:quinolinate synthase
MNTLYNVDMEKRGFLDIEPEKGINLVEEIKKLKKEKNAVILAHYYQEPEIQDIADFVGDSLMLAQQAQKTDARIIVLAGVHFMAETAKIINPLKKVLIPDSNAGCSLAESCKPVDFKRFVDENPGHFVITYVNTSAGIKALSDIICTSSNAVAIVKSLPQKQKIIFAPDRNLGNYINGITGRNMLVWQGTCYVHNDFSVERIIALKRENPAALLIAHPESTKQVLVMADFIGSTAELLKFTGKSNANSFIVATEHGIIHQMRKMHPEKVYIAAPPDDVTCACSECKYMKMISLKKLYICMKYEVPEVTLEKELMEKALKPVVRMLEISKKLGL